MRTCIFPAKFDYLDNLREFAAQAARDAGMDDVETYAIQLSVDEACSNIIEHAYGGQNRGDIECTCDSEGEALTIILRDHGTPFDPASVPIPDLSTGLYERKIGGLGVFLMQSFMDEVHFEALGGAGNVLTMVKRHRRKA